MPQENVETTLRDMIEAFSAGGIDAALPYFHREVTWHAPPEWLEQSVYTGHDGLRELAASWSQNFEETAAVSWSRRSPSSPSFGTGSCGGWTPTSAGRLA